MTSRWHPIIQIALKEDLPSGDVTTDNLTQYFHAGRARLVAKEDLVLSGSELFNATFQSLGTAVGIDWQFKDGDFAFKNQTLAVLKGPMQILLKGERVALNFLNHLSGVATLTRCYVREVSHTKTRILDTRKTLPGLRELQKMAVLHGGGLNHRMNLSAAVLIKENHIRMAGGMAEAVRAVRAHAQRPIEVEVTSLKEVKEAVLSQVQRIMFDNMSNEDMRLALEEIPPLIETEASGNMTLDRVKSVAELGVNYISIGAITHSAPYADISLLFES